MSGSPAKGVNCTLDGPVVDTSATKHQAEDDTASLHCQGMESPVSPGTLLTKGDDSSKKISEMQLQWHDGICRSMNIADGYERIAVLIIKWADHLDELSCNEEVERVHDFFKERMNYETEILELNGAEKPQLQLTSGFADFAKRHNGSSSASLMIVYYTGHSYFHIDTDMLEFYGVCKHKDDATSCPEKCGSKKLRAKWSDVERIILDATDSDTLAILDTCFASDVQKNMQEDSRTYQLLAASGRRRTTSAPGERSFTTALLNAFDELLDEKCSFNTHKLLEYINHQPSRRTNPAFLYDRQKKYEDWIILRPLTKDISPEKKTVSVSNRGTKSCLTLEFALAHKYLEKDQIDSLTKQLVLACKNSNVDAQNIRWHGFKHRSLWEKVLLGVRVSRSFRNRPRQNNSAALPETSQKPNLHISHASTNGAEIMLNIPNDQPIQLAVATEEAEVVSERTVVNNRNTILNQNGKITSAGGHTRERGQSLALNRKGLLCLVVVCFVFGDVFHLAAGISASIVTIVLLRSSSGVSM